MLIIDYLFILIIIFSSLYSFFRGFIKEILTTLIWCISFYLSKKYFHYLFYIKNTVINNLYFQKIFLLLISFILSLSLGYIINNYINKKIKYFNLSIFNKILGLFFGFFKGYFIVLFSLYFLNHFDKNLYNYILLEQKSLVFIYFHNLLYKYNYFL
ncbi:CvpA family protein [Enterobacteriaceae endosymbiont of Donacia semicuprea]|uniref:CvpA family protein n=1 Tax=Enterobacteriaceae endosymbiont of Donacia semicuprea TaxID=2675783 RepID=UPI00144A06EF|nr:CvpA family protein [Enterobacteriaceae endosymbiont of Donacia semicuprea]QJC32759.1 hypothetical protein GJT91_00355 [Enterobacteriaceae endosymbiont of Donacia semicuprea]